MGIMDLILSRKQKTQDGIFGELGDHGAPLWVTLEHAYIGAHGFNAKIPPGTYECIRGTHHLDHMTEGFETFEITGVEGHSGLLFHWGNFNKDSDGCILIGKEFAAMQGRQGIFHSRDAFKEFMALQNGLNSFALTISEE